MNELDVMNYFSSDIVERFMEVTQPRSKYQLEKFVINQHETPEMQYVQILLELKTMYYGLKFLELEIKKINLQIVALKKTKDEIDAVEAEIKELSL